MAYINGRENLLTYINGKENIFGVQVTAGKIEQWETLFEGDVTAEQSDVYPGAVVNFSLFSSDEPQITEGGAYRLTVDDGVYTNLFIYDGGSWSAIGNKYLRYPSYEDDGGNACLIESYNVWGGSYTHHLYTRTEGTYHVKVERMVI